MKKTDLMNKMSRTFHKVGFGIKKHSPEILVVAGVVGTVTSAVLACKATTKIGAILEESKETIDAIHTGMEEGAICGTEYNKEDGQKDLTIVYLQTGVKLAKLYAPAVILGGLSLAAIIKSNDILRKRNVALAAAYATIDKGFKEYRGRVIERFGKELDRELKYNIRAVEVEEKTVDENGNETTTKKTVNVAEINKHSDFARFFDEFCTGWTRDPEYNLGFLRIQNAAANEKLQREGHLFLNDVYAMLGMSKTRAGNVVGWVYDENNPEGDNYVDFGIYDVYDEAKRDFVNGRNQSILLDFNVDGPILDRVQWRDGYNAIGSGNY